MKTLLPNPAARVFIIALGLSASFPATAEAVKWDEFVSNFVESYFASHPDFAVRAGRHEFDGQLPDWSPEGFNTEIEWLKSERLRAREFTAESLDKRQQFEHDYLISVIDSRLFWIDSAKLPYKNPFFYSRTLDPDVYVSREYAPLMKRLQAYIRYAERIPAATGQVRNNLNTPLPRTYIELGKTIFGGFATYYEKDVPSIFSSVEDPELQTEFRSANALAVKAMQDLSGWFEDQRTQATEAFALGPDVFSKMLWETERVKVPLDQLEKLGRDDLERNLAALRKACQIHIPGKPVAKCIDKIQSAKPFDGPVAAARLQLPDLKSFLRSKQVVTIPGTEEAHVAEAPPYNRWNPAYIQIPGPFEKGLPSVYYVAPPNSDWSPEERKAYMPGKAFLLFISIHEVWPGHFLQHLHAHRTASRFGQLFTGYGFAEGWAHYAEELMLEIGFGRNSPETAIGQLANALLRNVRYLCAIGLHTQGMSLESCARMFRELAFQDVANSRQQAARGTFDPAYLNYTLGKLMIRKLRSEWSATRGGQKAWGAFHDKFLSFGAPPIPLVRNVMLGAQAEPPL